MSNPLNPHHAGLALGGLIGLGHAVWSLLVALGWAQGLLNWIFRLHMVQPALMVMPFSLVTALGLIIVTAVVGYVAGTVLATIWNAVQK